MSLARSIPTRGVTPSGNGTLLPLAQPIAFPRGASVFIKTDVVNSNGQPVDLEFCSLSLGVRAADGTSVFTRIGINAGSQSSFELIPADTIELAPGEYFWDAWITDATGQRAQIVLYSSLTILPSATLLGDELTLASPYVVQAFPFPSTEGQEGKLLSFVDGALKWSVVAGDGYEQLEGTAQFTSGGDPFVDVELLTPLEPPYLVQFGVWRTDGQTCAPTAAPRESDGGSQSANGFRIVVDAPFDGEVSWFAWRKV